MQLRGTGLWAFNLRYDAPAAIAEAAAELDELGYAALWIPDVGGDDLFPALDRLLTATASITVATGILNIWMHEPSDVVAWWSQLADDHRARLLLGLGVSHDLVVERYERPLAKMRQYLDQLDVEGLPPETRCLAALGPRMIELARARSAGVHPYLVTPEQTAWTREQLGQGPLIAVEQGVVLDEDPATARATARAAVAGYLQLRNYQQSWLRQGFTEHDFADGGTDRLIEAMVACGGVDAIAARVKAHHDAGADHVCIQVLQGRGSPAPRAAWREIAAAVTT